jgi:hypothetical protein
VILYVLLAGFLPFDEVSMVDLFRKIVKAEYQCPDWLSAEAVALLADILNPDPHTRATIKQIKQHAWYRAIALQQAKQELIQSQHINLTPKATHSTLAFPFDSVDEEGIINIDSRPNTGNNISEAIDIPGRKGLLNNNSGSNNSSVATTPIISPSLTPLASPNNNSNLNPADLSNNNNQMSPLKATRVTTSGLNNNSTAFLDDLSPPASPIIIPPTANVEISINSLSNSPIEAEFNPIKVNAFDLINMTSGAAMNRMFHRNSVDNRTNFTQFTSTKSINDIIDQLSACLQSIDNCSYRVFARYCQIKASKQTNKGKIFILIQIYEMTPNLHLIECRKMKGDIFEYYSLYNTLKYSMTGTNNQSLPLNSSHDSNHFPQFHQSVDPFNAHDTDLSNEEISLNDEAFEANFHQPELLSSNTHRQNISGRLAREEEGSRDSSAANSPALLPRTQSGQQQQHLAITITNSDAITQPITIGYNPSTASTSANTSNNSTPRALASSVDTNASKFSTTPTLLNINNLTPKHTTGSNHTSASPQ